MGWAPRATTATVPAVVEAEFDHLPFRAASFDLAIFNASIHYSTDYRRTLNEVRRCLRPGGHFVIIDSPIYRLPEHGEKMRAERHDEFETRYGFRSDALPSLEYFDEADPRRAGAGTEHSSGACIAPGMDGSGGGVPGRRACSAAVRRRASGFWTECLSKP